jgi:hypothetical protein
MSDILDKLNGTHREIDYRETPAGRVRSLLIRRAYDAKIADVWDAITDPERLSRWFLPVVGDLREGGTFQLKDNAGGEIRRCDAPDPSRAGAVNRPRDPSGPAFRSRG